MSRVERVSNAIKKEVSSIIQFELNDPRLGFITVLRVEISKDLEHAKIFYSVLGDKKSIEDSQEALNSAKGYIKKLVGDRLQLRLTPDLMFIFDNASEYSVYISNKIDEIRKKEEGKQP